MIGPLPHGYRQRKVTWALHLGAKMEFVRGRFLDDVST